MKKIVALLLIVMMHVTGSLAEEIDIDSMSLDQLIALDLRIEQKIYEMDSLSNSVLYPGRYIAGSDIETGEYLFRCVSFMPGRNLASIRKLDANTKELDLELLDLEESYRLRFDEGEMLDLENGVVVFLKK